MAWGYGMSPILKDREHTILAIAWGPLIQLVVMIDQDEVENSFILDGYYIIKCFEQLSRLSTKQKKLRKSVRFE